jgi:hypothetical protein
MEKFCFKKNIKCKLLYLKSMKSIKDH